MAAIFYYVMFSISLVLVIVYAYIFHKHFDANMTIMTILVPIINMGFVLMANSSTIEEALVALRLTYLGGCFLLVSAMFLIFKICKVNIPPVLRAVIVAISCMVYATTLTIGFNDLFYVRGAAFLNTSNGQGAAFIDGKKYGPMHTVFYVMVGIYYIATIGVIIYSFFKKKQVARRILILISISVTIAVIGFFGGRLITHDIEILPATYNLGMIIYLIIASRLRLYDASDSVIDSIVQKGETGFISLSHTMRYLASNDTAKEMFPELNTLTVDHSIKDNKWLEDNLSPLIQEYEKDESKDRHLIKRGDKSYLIHINRLRVSKLYRGYQVLITDDTVNQEYISLIKTYNSKLEIEVEKKTAHIQEMQEKLVLAMATMVEGRDNSTGGHIKRTSDGVRFLVDEMRKINFRNLDDNFYINLIRAAPMHDLGKITVDDAILRKPGRYTEEEFAQMKKHSEEGAKIVKQILEGTDNVEFMHIAINVAHYHHERWDGSGYPVGLKEEEIPLEARIMAIADVYDALVSKRVYKEKMSFEEADRIILEGMGKHFDPSLKEIYIKARPQFEEYYRNIIC